MSVDLTNEGYMTALHLSAYSGNLEATNTLVERNAGLYNVDTNGNTALSFAAHLAN
jgi:ankyrin repeat protein